MVNMHFAKSDYIVALGCKTQGYKYLKNHPFGGIFGSFMI